MPLTAMDFASAGVWIWLALFLSLGKPLLLISAQEGFISIDCGSRFNYTDSTTGLYWSTDDGYISTGVNAPVTVPSSVTSSPQQLSTARYFNESRSKNCYVLPVTTNTSYLVRAGFFYGNLDSSPPANYAFSLSIDSTLVSSVELTEAYLYIEDTREFGIASTSTQMFFCIIPVSGYAFISSLELRPLPSISFQGLLFESKYTQVLMSLNLGVPTSYRTVRYPDDMFDRLWHPPGPTSIRNLATNRSITYIPNTLFDSPPDKVMETAWTNNSFGFSTNLPPDTNSYYVAFYFVEVGTPNSTDVRSVDIHLNGASWYQQFNITDAVVEVHSPPAETIQANAANFSFSKNAVSTLDPLVNGAELHAIYDTIGTATDSGDVQALDDVRQNLGLLDWTGDPCLPIAWDWLHCIDSNPARVTEVKLSNYGISGTIPASIAGLSELTDLWLDNNFLTGSIPDLASLSNLETLHLENNSLTGPIPASLAYLLQLSELFLEGNKLSGPVPAGLVDKQGLNLQNYWLPWPYKSFGEIPCFDNDIHIVLVLVDSFTNGTSSPGKKSSGSGVRGSVIGAAIGAVVVVTLIIALIAVLCYRKLKSKTKPPLQSVITVNDAGSPVWNGSSSDFAMKSGAAAVICNHDLKTARAFSQEEVRVATRNFKKMIGEGGFGAVYYGELPAGGTVAVKVNSDTSGQGAMEFSTEVSLLSRVHHRNLVSLVGFCEEGNQQILIYEYMQNGTLRQHLYGEGQTDVLDWRTRLDIALNAARGLEYLHNDCSPKIIHRDVKSNNILLNEKFVAKVGDFGISKLAADEGNTSGVSTIVRGTMGYLDPEYFSTSKLTLKSDVYAFGVVLLEIISGRAPNDDSVQDVTQLNLVQYARTMIQDGNLQAIVDKSLMGKYNLESMWKLAELAMYSVEPWGTNRPDMRQVVREVTEAIGLESAPTSSSGAFKSPQTQENGTESSFPPHPSTPSSQPTSGTSGYPRYGSRDNPHAR